MTTNAPKDESRHIFTKATIEHTPETRHVHQFNPRAVRHTVSLSDIAGLSKVGLHLVRIAAGDETTTHHYHEESDEFVYILSGTLTLRYGEAHYSLSAGDFVGFPAHGAAHSMRNESDADATYLMGGSRPDIDITLYPEIDRKMYKIHGKKEYVDLEDLEDLGEV